MGIQKLNNEGFSLIEVMIAVAIMSVVGLGMSQMYISQSREQKRSEIKNTVSRLQMQVQAAATDPIGINGSQTAEVPLVLGTESNPGGGLDAKGFTGGTTGPGGASTANDGNGPQ